MLLDEHRIIYIALSSRLRAHYSHVLAFKAFSEVARVAFIEPDEGVLFRLSKLRNVTVKHSSSLLCRVTLHSIRGNFN